MRCELDISLLSYLCKGAPNTSEMTPCREATHFTNAYPCMMHAVIFLQLCDVGPRVCWPFHTSNTYNTVEMNEIL